MAFYKDYTKDRKNDHAAKGSWDDEGTHYRKPARGDNANRSDNPAFSRTGRSIGGAQPNGDRSGYRGRQDGAGNNPAYRARRKEALQPSRAQERLPPRGREASFPQPS